MRYQKSEKCLKNPFIGYSSSGRATDFCSLETPDQMDPVSHPNNKCFFYNDTLGLIDIFLNLWFKSRCHEIFLDDISQKTNVLLTSLLHLHKVIFSLQFVCVSICLSVCLSGSACEQNSSRMDEPILDAVFPKWLLTALKLVTLGQRSRSQ